MKIFVACFALMMTFCLSQVVAQDAKQPGAATKGGKNVKAAKANKGMGPTRWEETIKKFEEADAAKPFAKGGVLLIGGSNARRWTDVADYFPKHQVLNRGFGGAQLGDILHYIDRLVIPYEPKAIILNAGGNDLNSGKTPQQIREIANEFVSKVHAKLPDTQIYYIGIPPVMRASGNPGMLDGLREMNALLAKLEENHKNVHFVDLFPMFLGEDGKSKADLFVEDGTHFSPKGYEALASQLRDKL